jgi:hypothetical protein
MERSREVSNKEILARSRKAFVPDDLLNSLIERFVLCVAPDQTEPIRPTRSRSEGIIPYLIFYVKSFYLPMVPMEDVLSCIPG